MTVVQICHTRKLSKYAHFYACLVQAVYKAFKVRVNSEEKGSQNCPRGSRASRKNTYISQRRPELAFAQQGLFAWCAMIAFHEEDAEALLRAPLLAVVCPDDTPPTKTPATVKLELRGLSLLSAPVMVQVSAQYAVTVVNQYFTGHQGAGPLAAAAIGNTVSGPQLQSTGASVTVGFPNAVMPTH